MQKKRSYVLVFLIVLLFRFAIALGVDSNLSPAPSTKDQTILSSPKVTVSSFVPNFSVPRDQVLVEIATGTW